jgi:hypothetical protein
MPSTRPACSDPGIDLHVLVAASKCGADLILTFNLGDFPEQALALLSSLLNPLAMP